MKRSPLPKRYQFIGLNVGAGVAAVIGFMNALNKPRLGGPVSSEDLSALVFGVLIGAAAGGYVGRLVGNRMQRRMPPDQLALERQLEQEEAKADTAKEQVPRRKVLSSWAVYALVFFWIPVIGLLMAIQALRDIRSRGAELYGTTLAWIALVLGALDTIGIAAVTFCGIFIWK